MTNNQFTFCLICGKHRSKMYNKCEHSYLFMAVCYTKRAGQHPECASCDNRFLCLTDSLFDGSSVIRGASTTSERAEEKSEI
jgi:hypothetical protein